MSHTYHLTIKDKIMIIMSVTMHQLLNECLESASRLFSLTDSNEDLAQLEKLLCLELCCRCDREFERNSRNELRHCSEDAQPCPRTIECPIVHVEDVASDLLWWSFRYRKWAILRQHANNWSTACSLITFNLIYVRGSSWSMGELHWDELCGAAGQSVPNGPTSLFLANWQRVFLGDGWKKPAWLPELRSRIAGRHEGSIFIEEVRQDRISAHRETRFRQVLWW